MGEPRRTEVRSCIDCPYLRDQGGWVDQQLFCAIGTPAFPGLEQTSYSAKRLLWQDPGLMEVLDGRTIYSAAPWPKLKPPEWCPLRKGSRLIVLNPEA